MIDLSQQEVWFVTGSQHLYGEKTLQQVAANARQIAEALGRSAAIPVRVVFKPVLTTPDAITELCREANAAANCVGLICWMHTFSPAKMWIGGLTSLQKPFVHLHTQYQSRDSLGHHRHGLHEPEPGRPRRPRVRVHLYPAAEESGGGGRLLAGRRRPGRAGHLGPRRRRLGRRPGRKDRPFRRQYAGSGRHRGR